MIVFQVADSSLRRALVHAVGPEEDTFDLNRFPEAMELGFPRLLVRDGPRRHPVPMRPLPVIEIDEPTRRRWFRDARDRATGRARVDLLAERMAPLIEPDPGKPTWVDRLLADISRVAGAKLPVPFRAFARRVLEYPAHYRSLEPLATACDMTPGALKARFRRRGLASPSVHLRWLRLLAVGEMLVEPAVTVAAAANRLGFTSDGNLCRTLANVTGMTPTDLRARSGRRRLLLTWTSRYLGRSDLEGWNDLSDLFGTTRAA